MANHAGRWEGGPIYLDRHGQQVFVIEKTHAGVRYTIRLKADNENRARGQLALFEADPVGFKKAHPSTRGKAAGEAARRRQVEEDARKTQQRIRDEGAVVSTESIKELLKYLRAQPPWNVDRTARNEQHVQNIERYLADWGDILRGRPLHTVSAAELVEHLNNWPFEARKGSRRYKVVALKAFASFQIHEKHVLKANENPMAEIKIPHKERGEEEHETYAMHDVEEHYTAVALQCVRDVLVLRAKGGLHHSEIERMAKHERTTVLEVDDHPVIAAVVTFPHKNRKRKIHRQLLDAQMLAALRRLQQRGGAPTKETMIDEMREVATRLSAQKNETVTHLHPSRLRHSFQTWGGEVGERFTLTGKGLSAQDLADISNHSVDTSRAHYNKAPPPFCKLPIKLVHPDDPVLPTKSTKGATVYLLPTAG
jgi:site-specific recombinase XerC